MTIFIRSQVSAHRPRRCRPRSQVPIAVDVRADRRERARRTASCAGRRRWSTVAGSGSTRPLAKLRAASSAFAGSAPKTRMPGDIARGGDRRPGEQPAAAHRRDRRRRAPAPRRAARAPRSPAPRSRARRRTDGSASAPVSRSTSAQAASRAGDVRRAEADRGAEAGARSPASPSARSPASRPTRGCRAARAAYASAAPWLPDECVTTPRARIVVRQREHRVGRAARLERADLLEVLALEEEPRARPRASSERQVSTGVRCTCGAIRAARGDGSRRGRAGPAAAWPRRVPFSRARRCARATSEAASAAGLRVEERARLGRRGDDRREALVDAALLHRGLGQRGRWRRRRSWRRSCGSRVAPDISCPVRGRGRSGRTGPSTSRGFDLDRADPCP